MKSMQKSIMRLLIAGVFLVLSIFVFDNLAYAQNSSNISASTNSPSYDLGDKVIITGSIQQATDSDPVTIIVRNPIGNVYEVGQVSIMNNLFVHDFVLSDDAQSGIYTVNIRQGDQTSQIQFQVITGQTQIIPVFDSEIRVSGKDANLVKYGNAQVSASDDSITIQMDTTKIQNGTITEEYHVPKHVVDAIGGQLIIKEDGNSLDCIQTETDLERSLECPIQSGAKEITFIGTTVIPEFPIVSYVLILSIISVIFLSQNKLLHKLR